MARTKKTTRIVDPAITGGKLSILQGNLTRAATGVRRLYAAEIDRLTSELRHRIVAGEFSGTAPEDMGEPRFFQLEEELLEHPWTATRAVSMMVFACSCWFWNENSDMDVRECVSPSGHTWVQRSAAECIANDVLTEAVRRGWVEAWSDAVGSEPYLVRSGRMSA